MSFADEDSQDDPSKRQDPNNTVSRPIKTQILKFQVSFHCQDVSKEDPTTANSLWETAHNNRNGLACGTGEQIA
jgi:hypothetical protein